jgi:carbon monoxide dehydrogenase subunit G
MDDQRRNGARVTMLKIIAIAVVVLVAAVLLFAATRPDNFSVQRTTSIKAPPEKIFALINDLHRWGSWSPWEKMDPEMKRTYSGAASGKGAVYAWQGNSKVGGGRMEISDTSPPSKITIRLDFVKPIEGHNTAEFTLEPKGDFTNVTWTMYGPTSYIAKVMGIFVSMDKMIGKEFETGLANLKTVAEA